MQKTQVFLDSFDVISILLHIMHHILDYIRDSVSGKLLTPCLPHKNVAGFLVLAPVEWSTIRKNSALVRVLVWIHRPSCLILLSWKINYTGDLFLIFFYRCNFSLDI